MKKLLLIAALSWQAGSPASAQSVTYGRCDTFTLHQPNLVMYYNFSGSAGGPVTDLSGHGHTGIPAGLVTNAIDAAGNPDCAMQFPGLANHHIKISSSPDFDFANQPATISVWYKAHELAAGKYEQLAGRGLGYRRDGYGQYSLGLYDCRKPVASINGTARRDVHDTLGCNDTSGTYLYKWNHVVVVFDNGGSGPTYPTAVYVNDININIGASGPATPLSIDTGSFYLGDNFKGFMDEVRVYNVAFSAADVSALYAYGIMGCCTETASLADAAADPLAVQLSPNPTTGDMRASMPKDFAGGRIRIFNILGQEVYTAGIRGQEERLQLQALPAGTYVLQLSTATGDRQHRKTLIKN